MPLRIPSSGDWCTHAGRDGMLLFSKHAYKPCSGMGGHPFRCHEKTLIFRIKEFSRAPLLQVSISDIFKVKLLESFFQVNSGCLTTKLFVAGFMA